ncbi:unnamed protein product [Periconia digitata]|uniref:Uncharacterized protein n=1 Tax=Periconia digitata TaxID=1303443 RepID=A0A9W4UIF2_9PLEO|nr:unnamed protein product [Periconia digitata]
MTRRLSIPATSPRYPSFSLSRSARTRTRSLQLQASPSSTLLILLVRNRSRGGRRSAVERWSVWESTSTPPMLLGWGERLVVKGGARVGDTVIGNEKVVVHISSALRTTHSIKVKGMWI